MRRKWLIICVACSSVCDANDRHIGDGWASCASNFALRSTQIAQIYDVSLSDANLVSKICGETCAVGARSDANDGPRSDANRWFSTSVSLPISFVSIFGMGSLTFHHTHTFNFKTLCKRNAQTNNDRREP